MNKDSLFGTLLQVRKLNRDLSYQDEWGLQDSSLESYLASFKDIITQDELVQIIDKNKGYQATLDLMGSGSAWEDTSVDAILGVTLSDKDYSIDRRTVLGGDVLSKKTWKRIRSYLNDKELEGFNIITCRPEGGIHTLPDNKDLFGYLLSEAVSLLHEGGVLLTQLPGSLSHETSRLVSQQLVEDIEAKMGVSVYYQSSQSFGLPSKISAIRVDKLVS